MPAMGDVTLQLDLSARLVLAAVFGAAVGFERELHGHPAGMRTHLLVSLGSALFTVLSIYGFAASASAPVDPTRIAAQIVSGIGFLGAGAILKEGLSIRGLTTAASLWATAAVGLAAGAGQHVLAVVGTAIIVFSLWPLNLVADRIHGLEKQLTRIRIALERLDALAPVTKILTDQRLEIVGIQTQRIRKGRYEVDIDVTVRPASNLGVALEAAARIDGVEIIEAGTTD
jgi:putative Mg2+ transporter-C (MgtC) family protein